MRFVKLLIWTFLTILILLSGIAISIPKIVSTNKGREVVFSWVNKTIPGKISVSKVDLNWFRGQLIENFSLKDDQGKEIFRFDSFKTDETLVSWLFGKCHLGKTELVNPYLVYEEGKKRSNIRRAFGLKGRSEQKANGDNGFKAPCFKGEIVVKNGTIELISNNVPAITISQINIEIKESFSEFHIVGKTSKPAGGEGEILVKGSLGDNFHVEASLHNFPPSMLDQFRKTNLYESALGPSFDLDLELLKKEGNLTLNATLAAPNLNGTFKGVTKGKTFYLEEGDLVFTITPAFFKAFFQTKEWELANRPQLVLHIEKLILPLGLEKLEFCQIPVLGTMTLERVEISHHILGALSMNNFVASIETFDDIEIKYSAMIQGQGEPTNFAGNFQIFPDKTVTFATDIKAIPIDVLELFLTGDLPYLHKILGDQISLKAEGKFNDEITTKLALSSPTFTLDGIVEGSSIQNLHADMKGEVHLPKRYATIFGKESDMTLSTDFSYHEKTLAFSDIAIKMENQNFEFNVKGNVGEKGKPFDYKDVKMSGNGTLRHLPLYRDVIDYHGNFLFQFDGGKNELLGSASLNSRSRGGESLIATLTARNIVKENQLRFDQGEINLDGKLNDFPIHFIDTFFDYKVKFYPLLGPFLDLNMRLRYAPDIRTVIDLEAKSTGFLLQVALGIDGKIDVKSDKPSHLRWELNESRYQYLMGLFGPERASSFVLEEGGFIDVKIERLECPKFPVDNLQSFLCASGFKGNIEVAPITFANPKTKEKMRLFNTHGTLFGEDFSKTFSFNLTSDIASSIVPQNQKSGFSCHLEALNFLTKEGKFNKNLSVKGEVILDLIPVGTMSGILPMKQKTRDFVYATCGELLNSRIYGEVENMAGPLTIDVKASNFKGIFPVQFNNDSLTLRSGVEAELTLTEKVNEILMKDLNPILISGVWSDHPIRLYIDPQGFYVHLKPFTLRGVSIENIAIDFGKVRVKNGGQILSLMKFLKAKEISPEGVMEAWFTPIYMSLKEGTTTYKRFDALLAGNIHIALWGKIDLIKDKVKMTLGISSSAIKQSFKVKGLSTDEMFQVKMRGSTGELELDWSSASTRIGILLTRTAGGIGYLVGGLLEQLVGILGEETTPPPTTSPFPWEITTPPTSLLYKADKATSNMGLKKVWNFLIPWSEI